MYLTKKITRFLWVARYCPNRFFSTKPLNKINIEHLQQRAILKLSGNDTLDYLQSMITNDIKRIDTLPSLYSLLLNPQGRVLYDIILYKLHDNEYFVEYDSTAVKYLHKHLLMYRLRKDVKIEPLNDLSTWAVFKNSEDTTDSPIQLKLVSEHLHNESILASIDDPRNSQLGVRVVTRKNFDLRNTFPDSSLVSMQNESHRILRYKLGIGEGVEDHPPGNCLPFETNVDFLNGLSFTKGCYIGQELTARAHFVLTVRKRLMPVVLQPMDIYPVFPPECDVVNEKKQKVGRLRSHLGKHGLALLKYEECMKANYLQLQGHDVKLKAIWPNWWPAIANNKSQSS